MTEHCQDAEPRAAAPRDIEFSDGTFLVDAALMGELLDMPASRVPILMREGAITSACERGVEDNEGEFRLSFFYRNRRARLSMDAAGRVIRRSVIDFGDRPIPNALHR
jgi:Family of unknown function (DUF6522)